jgi:hypothetical protein
LSWATEKWWLPGLLLGMAVGWALDATMANWMH